MGSSCPGAVAPPEPQYELWQVPQQPLVQRVLLNVGLPHTMHWLLARRSSTSFQLMTACMLVSLSLVEVVGFRLCKLTSKRKAALLIHVAYIAGAPFVMTKWSA